MAIPTELIVVGMRFQPHYAKSKLTVQDRVTLVKEPSNKINNKAVAVHFQLEGETVHAGNRIGYIRDADLHKLNWADFQYDAISDLTSFNIRFKVNRICTNYLRIVPVEGINTVKPTGSFGTITNSTGGIHPGFDTAGYLRNPCAEFTLHADTLKVGSLQAINSSYTTIQTKEKPKMINTNSMRDSFFREVTNVALDMQSGKLGVVSKDGISVFTKDGISVNPITEMGFKVPAFAMRVAVTDLKEGDIIIGSGDPTFFVQKTEAGYVTMSLSGVLQEVGNVTNMFFGKNSVLAVKNMFGDTSGGGMNQGMMMAMMMGSDSDSKSGDGFDMKKMMMMQMMMGNQGSADGQMNPMMLMMMMGK